MLVIGTLANGQQLLQPMRAQFNQQIGVVLALQFRLQPAIKNLGANCYSLAGLRRGATRLTNKTVNQLFQLSWPGLQVGFII
ncbi:hypothetical protein BSZ31_04660 [Limnobacter sp. SAORIC-690]|nr:hypothetical protein BSZ31_04660 [Limnobacter sp. SAORIC-690]